MVLSDEQIRRAIVVIVSGDDRARIFELNFVEAHVGSDIFPTIRADTNLDRDLFVHMVTQQFAHNMEQFIGQHPEQWYIFRRIWPDQPLPAEVLDAQPLSAQAG